MTEASVIAIAGGALGVVVAYVLLPVFVSTGASALPSTTVVALRVPELLVGLGLGWLTSLIFGVAPAVVASRVDVLDALRGSTQVTANRTVRAMRGALVAVEVLLAVVVLAGAGLLIRSFAHVVSMPLGYDAHGVISADVPLVRPEDHAKENVSLLIDQMTAELRTALGPVPLAFADSMPFGSLLSNEFTLSSSAGEPQTAKPRWSELHIVSPSYFETLRMPLIRGRLFAQNGEDDAAGVAVVSEEFVRQFAAGRDVIGSIVSTPHARDFTIIGVVGDVRTGSLTITPGAAIYQPIGGRAMSQVAVALRAPDRDANRVSTAIREAVRHHDPDLPAVRVSSLEAKLATRQAKREFYLWTLSLFGGLAGVLAAVGIYGVMAHVVGLRAREVGIRLALGARPSQIKLLVVGQGLRPVMIGLAGGLVVAWWTTDLLRVNTVFASQLFHVTPHDPWTFAAACAGLLGVAVIACWIPARRTSRLDPAAVLKAE